MANNYQDLNALLRSLTAFQSGNAQDQSPPDQLQPPISQVTYGQQIYGQQQYSNQQLGYEMLVNQHHESDQAYTNQSHPAQNIGTYADNPYSGILSQYPINTPQNFTVQQQATQNLHHFPTNQAQSNAYSIPTAINAFAQPAAPPYADPSMGAFLTTPGRASYEQQAELEPVESTTPPMRHQQAAPPDLDPRTIVTWPFALRYITRLAARNEDLGNSIRKLITNQHDNERQWWASRQALVEKQTARVEGKRKLDDVLRAVGALVSSGTITDDVAELATYDVKVHKASTKMFSAMSADLEAMGIPFFCTKSELVDPTEPNSTKGKIEGENRSYQAQKKLTKAELVKLQRRMIQHLEDMYNE